MIELATTDSPIGPLTLAARAGRLCLLHFGPEDDHVRRWIRRWYPAMRVVHSPDPAGAVSTLGRYFGGALDVLDDMAVELNGTPFQTRVWQRLREVRAGSTASYAELARLAGAAKAVRAVGAANGANPVAVVVPCHRIIGTNGSLTGYGGGLERKQWLLRHEGAVVAAALF
ncbi:MAG TPA: methylated-DNA--[protein]-cysteine S-methyltransferase [Vicinamibacterales bacterium]|nr:methylated-DNA--[protein]-cysteine S-methyltransferase [Vicinamibacterales bacterium]